MNFISFKYWLNEQKGKKEYGCVMLDTHIVDWKKTHLSKIDKEDLYTAEDDTYGYNNQPHITVIYGLHLDETKPKDIIEKMKEMYQITSEIKQISIFENEKYDVVKYDVPVTKELKKFRSIFSKFPNTQDFPDYHPHITIAYVKKGEGKKYVQKLKKPFELTFDEATYSYNKTRKIIKLKNNNDN